MIIGGNWIVKKMNKWKKISTLVLDVLNNKIKKFTNDDILPGAYVIPHMEYMKIKHYLVKRKK